MRPDIASYDVPVGVPVGLAFVTAAGFAVVVSLLIETGWIWSLPVFAAAALMNLLYAGRDCVRLRLTGDTLRWATIRRAGELSLSSVRGVRPSRLSWIHVVIDHDAGRLRVFRWTGLSHFVASVARLRPDIQVRLGWWDGK